MVWRLLLTALLLVLHSGLFGAESFAAEPDPEKAKVLYGEAKRLHEEGRVRESMVKLQEAYEAYPSQAILVSIVNRHLDLGEVEQAAELIEHIEGTRGKIKRQVDRLRRQIEKAIALPVTVRLTADVMEATVSVDGAPPVPLPARIDLPRGTHRFLFEAPGRSSVEREAELRGTAEFPISVSLPVPKGQWRVTIKPMIPLKEVRLLLDGKAVRLGKSEMDKHATELRDVLPGSYKLTCLRGFEARADATFTVESGQSAAVTCTFPETASLDVPIWAWITGGAAVAAFATGAGLIVSYNEELPQLQAEFNDPRYVIESSKPAWGWTMIGLGTALSVASGLFFGKVFE